MYSMLANKPFRKSITFLYHLHCEVEWLDTRLKYNIIEAKNSHNGDCQTLSHEIKCRNDEKSFAIKAEKVIITSIILTIGPSLFTSWVNTIF